MNPIEEAYLRMKQEELAERAKCNSKKEDASNDQSDDGEGLDKADPKAAAKKFKDRKDKDIDNDGDVDDSDEYLHKKRKAISKDMEESVCPECGKEHPEGECEMDESTKKEAIDIDDEDGDVVKKKDDDKKKKKKGDDEVNDTEEPVAESVDSIIEMSDEDFDSYIEGLSEEQYKELEEGIGSAIAKGAKAVGAGVKKVADRFSTSGRADAAEKKLAKIKQKQKDRERLKRAQAGIDKQKADMKKRREAEKARVNEMKQKMQEAIDPKHGDQEKLEPRAEGEKQFKDNHKVDVFDFVPKDDQGITANVPARQLRTGDNDQGDGKSPKSLKDIRK